MTPIQNYYQIWPLSSAPDRLEPNLASSAPWSLEPNSSPRQPRSMVGAELLGAEWADAFLLTCNTYAWSSLIDSIYWTTLDKLALGLVDSLVQVAEKTIRIHFIKLDKSFAFSIN
jgi:hypothetical protein